MKEIKKDQKPEPGRTGKGGPDDKQFVEIPYDFPAGEDGDVELEFDDDSVDEDDGGDE